jgi:hypothetical protein
MADLSKRWRSASPLCTSKRTRTESPVSPTRVPVEFTSFLPLKGTTTTTQGKRRFLSFLYVFFKRLLKAVFIFIFFYKFRIKLNILTVFIFLLNSNKTNDFDCVYAVRIVLRCLVFKIKQK